MIRSCRSINYIDIAKELVESGLKLNEAPDLVLDLFPSDWKNTS